MIDLIMEDELPSPGAPFSAFYMAPGKSRSRMRHPPHPLSEPCNEIIGVLYLDSRERGALRTASAKSALDTLSAEAALAIENARLYREALDKAKFEQELKVAAAIQQSLLPIANREGAFFSTAAASVACAGAQIATSASVDRNIFNMA